MILASVVLSQYARITDDRQTDRRHHIPIAELAMQLQRSAKNRSTVLAGRQTKSVNEIQMTLYTSPNHT